MGSSARPNVAVTFQAAGIQDVQAALKLIREQLAVTARQAAQTTAQMTQTLGASGSVSSRIVADSERLGERYTHGARQIAFAVDQIAASGAIGERSLHELVGEGALMATAFGPEGMVVGAVAAAGVAIVHFFEKARDEARKTREAFMRELDQMENAGNFTQLMQKARELQMGLPSERGTGGINGVTKQLADAQAALLAFERANPVIPGRRPAVQQVAKLMQLTKIVEQLTEKLKALQSEEDDVTFRINNPPPLERPIAGLPTVTATGPKPGAESAALKENIQSLQQLHDTRRMEDTDMLRAVELTRMLTEQLARLTASTNAGTPAIEKQRAALADMLETLRKITDVGLTPRVRPSLATTEGVLSDRIQGLPAALLPDPQAFAKTIDERYEAIERAAADAVRRTGDNIVQVIDAELKTGIGEALHSAFVVAFETGSITQSLKSFGAAILSTFGAILVQLGEQVVAASAIIQAIETAFRALSPVGMLAGGLALIAFGSALEALGSNLTSGGFHSGGGSRVSGSMSSGGVPPTDDTKHVTLSGAGLSTSGPLGGALGAIVVPAVSGINAVRDVAIASIRALSGISVTPLNLMPAGGLARAPAQPITPRTFETPIFQLIGADDPVLQRRLHEIVQKGRGRGFTY